MNRSSMMAFAMTWLVIFSPNLFKVPKWGTFICLIWVSFYMNDAIVKLRFSCEPLC